MALTYDAVYLQFFTDHKMMRLKCHRSLSLQHEVALMYDAVYLLAQALEQYDQTTILRPFNASCENPVHWTSGRTLYTLSLIHI